MRMLVGFGCSHLPSVRGSGEDKRNRGGAAPTNEKGIGLGFVRVVIEVRERPKKRNRSAWALRGGHAGPREGWDGRGPV
jgi:hypothetical protein